MRKLLLFLLISIAAHATSYRMSLYDCKGNIISTSRMAQTTAPTVLKDTFDESHYTAMWTATKRHLPRRPVATVCFVSLRITESRWCAEEEKLHIYRVPDKTWFAPRDTLTVTWRITRWIDIDPKTHVARVYIKVGMNV